jgi:hypothetical protein
LKAKAKADCAPPHWSPLWKSPYSKVGPSDILTAD